MSLFNNKRKDYSIRPPRQQVNTTPFFVTDSANIDFTLNNLNLTADLTFTGVVAGTYGDATHIPILVIDQWGRVTGVTTVPIGGGPGGTYTVNNGLTPDPLNANNFQLGGNLTGNTTINTAVASRSLRFDAAGGLNAFGAYAFTAIAAITPQLPNHVLASFRADDCTVASFTGQSFNGTGGTAVKIVSQHSSIVPLDIFGPSGIALLKVADTGLLTLGQYTTSTSFGSGLTSVGVLNVDNTGKVFVTPAPTGTGTVTSVGTGTGLTGGPITTTGTISLNTKLAPADSLAGNSLKYLRVNAGETAVEYANVSSGSLLNDTTGILFGGALSATIGGTTFSVTAGIGQIVTQTASISGVVTTVSNVIWSAVTGAAITNIGTSQFTYVLVNSSGTVIQQTTPFTDAQYKTHIIIGILCHINLASVNLVTNSQNVAYEDPHRLVELITSFGPIKKIGLNIGPNGANLRVNRTSGEAFKIGSNYIADQFEPDVANISAQTPVLLCRVHRNGSGGFIFDTNGGSYYNDIDPSNYDNGSGTLQSVGGSKWTIQRLFFFPNNPVDIICYYGTQVYNQFSEARANLEFETFDEAQITAENAIFLGFLFVRNAATNLSLSTQAAFLQSGLFRGIPPGGGGSGGGGNSIGELTSPGDVTTPAATAPSQGVTATLKSNLKTGSFGVTVDGVTTVVQVGQIGYVVMPYDGTITRWTITSNVSGSISFDIWKDTLIDTIPTIGDSIVGGVYPSITGTNFLTSTNLSSWTSTTFLAGHIFGFYVNSASTIKNATLTLRVTKS